ncbi:MAG: cyclic nucleotide-binding domain-containing protein, partial [Epsilonproteobacteria bacterium]|nr:cyclic nucleotide-binding domain-containing protein [Campylobacterota bacterium]
MNKTYQYEIINAKDTLGYNFIMDTYFDQLRSACSAYYDFSDESFEAFKKICFVKEVKKGDILQDTYSKAQYIYFICKGILRTYYLNERGDIYTKNLFSENYFSASKVSLLTKEDSYLNIEALEDCTLVYIDFEGYKKLIESNSEVKDFYISYLEKNWIIVKESNEI